MDRLRRLRLGLEGLIQSVFAFENPVHPLGQRILGTVIDLGHAHGQPPRRRQLHVRVAAVLAAAIRVVDGVLADRQLLERHLQRLLATDRLQTVSAVIAHNVPRNLVGQQRQKHESLLRPQIRQIPHPNLIGTVDFTSFDQIPEHRQAMIRVRRPRPLRTPAGQQQVLLAQHLKKPVPPQPHPRLGQRRPQQHPQLAAPQPGLQMPLRSHQPTHQLAIHGPPPPLLTPGVIVLPRHPQLVTDTADAHPH